MAGEQVLHVFHKTTSITKDTALFDKDSIHSRGESLWPTPYMTKFLSTSNSCDCRWKHTRFTNRMQKDAKAK
ncbi:hypothetical protein E4U34_005483 [Claviceps purpurea]|nr:hypothetical protein E4U34_005483 [Claviceps purpurea]